MTNTVSFLKSSTAALKNPGLPGIEKLKCYLHHLKLHILSPVILLFILPTGQLVADEKTQNTVPSMTVTTSTPRTVVWPNTLTIYGDIAPWQNASISSQIGGYQLVDVSVNIGDIVKKGQILARFDRSLLLAEQAELVAGFEQAKAELTRLKALKNSKAVSEQDLLQAETQAKVSEAQLIKNQLQLKFTDVIAPDDGVITSRSATLGATISVGQELFQLIRKQRLEWRGEVTPEQFNLIKPGQRVTLLMPDNTSTSAIIRQKSPYFDSNTRLATVFADIPENGNAVAGMFVSGNVSLGMSEALIVPAKSVVIRDGRTYVLAINEDKDITKVSLHFVETGRRKDSDVEIISSFKNVEKIVVEGAGFLSEGDIVRIVSQAEMVEVQ
ncbi:efflux RND transporter periplasmic adaptor subunit [Planctobacterium marinum]|uniref:efflux RND transporter periplasmic adaptor subunit n=1 Tax=Planctobacterium marinum TaxID=1631968 RepID=UPI001E5528B8|nr:efflux RND transporter periplasmic adaptor subunit [Planctobacterium marinum]MCC2603996.1 efflux RND transporter periplasmic adaptor subunit [Planctobacterium marinum]